MKITIRNGKYVYIFMNIVLAVAVSLEPTYSKLINLFYKGVYDISTNFISIL